MVIFISLNLHLYAIFSTKKTCPMAKAIETGIMFLIVDIFTSLNLHLYAIFSTKKNLPNGKGFRNKYNLLDCGNKKGNVVFFERSQIGQQLHFELVKIFFRYT